MFRFILILLIVSGAIAFIGNYIGRYFGKKRLTIFNLRPRHTATAFTILSGILIAIITLTAILIVSQDARTALFGLKKLKEELNLKIWERDQLVKELETISKTVETAKKEMGELTSLQKKLREELETARRGVLLFKIGEPLITRILEGGKDQSKALKNMLTIADVYVRRFGIQSEKHLIFVSPEDFKKAVNKIKKQSGDVIVRLSAAKNTAWGEIVEVKFEFYKNALVFRKGEELASDSIDPKLPQSIIELKLKNNLSRVHALGSERGILRDPSGSIGNVPYSAIFETAKKIKRLRREILVKIVAASDIFTFGPLEVEFKLYRK